MKANSLSALWLGLLLLLTACDAGHEALIGQQSKPFNSSGRWLVVNYWAVWCKPCVTEIPELNALARAEPNLMVLGVNFDQVGLKQLQVLRDKLGIEFPLLTSDARHLGLEKPSVLPTTYLINPAGEVAMTLIGPQSVDSLLFALKTTGY
ncbi:TlpA disulfide reductase family protein [Simiduia curdlanivorans]|uniref:TlpA family protein disulfide reductase n=1 Tax=Simiduia curdlanivorans TaxID=1492769 RepID=A0ABV8V097_9GAMM|nr:TlpA disulfide reductase family protein [Simiduia curdlanivorans]MDN3640452.1 TlpA disulfide reductase family protein [Simiduia curdlanivorans]